jgi:hypothetical protein
MIALEHSCEVSHHQNPLTIPCGRRQRKQNKSENLLHHEGYHKDLGPEATLKKDTLFMNTHVPT